MLHVAAFAVGFFLDLLLGDPHWLYHPVRLIGWLIARLEKILRSLFRKSPAGETAAGVALVILVCLFSSALPFVILRLCALIHPWLAAAVEAIMCYQILAVKSLKTESMKVCRELEKGDLPAARRAVSMIVGRDTDSLNEEGVARAAVETVAENTSDGIAAPMLFLAFGGPVLGFFYKAVNTMDSMVGYRNESYLYFGKAAARFDDVLNFIPARVCSWLMVLAAVLLGMDSRNAAKVYLRDKGNSSSPNSAHTEAACAGALHVRLGGEASYFGKPVKKPYIGDDGRNITPETIRQANRLMYGTAVILFLLCLYIRAAVFIL